MTGRLRQWCRLPAHERRQLLVYALLLPMIHAGLHWLGLRRTQAVLHRCTPHASRRNADPATLQWAQRSAQLAAIAGRHGAVTTTCLRQALAVEAVLRRRGLQPELKFGVDRIGANPDMHAWVELDGCALAQPELRHAAFSAMAASRHADTAVTTSGKRK
jgi:hypothetical protein